MRLENYRVSRNKGSIKNLETRLSEKCVYLFNFRWDFALFTMGYFIEYLEQTFVSCLLLYRIGYGIGLYVTVSVYIYVRASRSTTLSSNNVLHDVRNFQKSKTKKKIRSERRKERGNKRKRKTESSAVRCVYRV